MITGREFNESQTFWSFWSLSFQAYSDVVLTRLGRVYPSVTAKAFTGASEMRAAPDETRIGGFVGARVSGIGFRHCRAEWIRERRLHQAGIPRSLPGHRPETRTTEESRDRRKGRDPESRTGRRLAAHGGGDGRKAGVDRKSV